MHHFADFETRLVCQNGGKVSHYKGSISAKADVLNIDNYLIVSAILFYFTLHLLLLLWIHGTSPAILLPPQMLTQLADLCKRPHSRNWGFFCYSIQKIEKIIQCRCSIPHLHLCISLEVMSERWPPYHHTEQLLFYLPRVREVSLSWRKYAYTGLEIRPPTTTTVLLHQL